MPLSKNQESLSLNKHIITDNHRQWLKMEPLLLCLVVSFFIKHSPLLLSISSLTLCVLYKAAVVRIVKDNVDPKLASISTEVFFSKTFF